MIDKSVLRIVQLNKSYEKRVVLRNVNLEITDNEYVGLVGVNGAGKSTLIKAVLDFISIDSGTITIYGSSHKDNAARDVLSFLPEKFSPPRYLTGKHFLSYMAELHRIKLDEWRIKEIFDVLDLDISILNKPIRQYSKGMTQKLGLVSCFLGQHPLLILDEPMSGLDPNTRILLKRYLLTLKEKGKNLFFSTHLLNDVESLCDRIIILHHSEIRFDGRPKACCEKFHCDTLEDAYLACVSTEYT